MCVSATERRSLIGVTVQVTAIAYFTCFIKNITSDSVIPTNVIILLTQCFQAKYKIVATFNMLILMLYYKFKVIHYRIHHSFL